MTAVGDVLDGAQLAELPVGAVVVHDEPGLGFNTVTRTSEGYSWLSGGTEGVGRHSEERGPIYVGNWTLVHLPPVEPLKVGDRVNSSDFLRLPVGSVAVDSLTAADQHNTVTRINDGVLWTDVAGGKSDTDFYADKRFTDFDEPSPSWTIVYIPGADSSAGRTAA